MPPATVIEHYEFLHSASCDDLIMKMEEGSGKLKTILEGAPGTEELLTDMQQLSDCMIKLNQRGTTTRDMRLKAATLLTNILILVSRFDLNSSNISMDRDMRNKFWLPLHVIGNAARAGVLRLLHDAEKSVPLEE